MWNFPLPYATPSVVNCFLIGTHAIFQLRYAMNIITIIKKLFNQSDSCHNRYLVRAVESVAILFRQRFYETRRALIVFNFKSIYINKCVWDPCSKTG